MRLATTDHQRRVRGPALLFVAALVLAACSSSSASPPSPSDTPVYRFGVVRNRGAISQLQLNRPTQVAGISGRVVQIATSNSDGYARTSSGAVWACAVIDGRSEIQWALDHRLTVR